MLPWKLIFLVEIGYGLAVCINDINSDGWDDIYVSNDFFEDDYLYINQKMGLLKNNHKYLSQTSQFSMEMIYLISIMTGWLILSLWICFQKMKKY